MSREKNDKNSDKKPGKKRKYEKPKLSRHGSLQGIAERVTGPVSSCCLTRRAKAALHSSRARRRLLEDVGSLVLLS